MDFDQADALVRKWAGKPGLRAKINAKCIDCSYDPKGSGNWRQQVSACAVVDCPLYSVRPISVPRHEN